MPTLPRDIRAARFAAAMQRYRGRELPEEMGLQFWPSAGEQTPEDVAHREWIWAREDGAPMR